MHLDWNSDRRGSSGAQPVCDVRCAPAGTRTRTLYYGVRKVSGNAEGPRGAYFITAPLYIRPSWVKLMNRTACEEIVSKCLHLAEKRATTGCNENLTTTGDSRGTKSICSVLATIY